MKDLYNCLNIIQRLKVFLVTLVNLLILGFAVNAQTVNVPFAQRTSTFTPDKKIYNIKGDFTMMGNTNLTFQSYGSGGDTRNNNGQAMRYVNVDPNMVNSSSATLQLSNENGADPNCSKIIYAGLYWMGVSQAGNGTFTKPRKTYALADIPGNASARTGTISHYNGSTTASNNNGYVMPLYTNYKMTVSIQSSNGSYPRYTLESPNPGDATLEFEFYNLTNSSENNQKGVRYRQGTTLSWTNVSGLLMTNSSNTQTATFTAVEITTSIGTTLSISSLVRDRRTNRDESQYQSSSKAIVLVSGKYNKETGSINVTLDKRKVKIKGPGASTYDDLESGIGYGSNIFYPASNSSSNNYGIFVGYTEITEYVQAHGLGEYTIADIALLDGTPASTDPGSSGGWGMVVVYENSKMNWRDVTVFDGYANITSGSKTLDISGFNTAQTGDVKIKLGVMAAEGDVSYTGDYLEIRKGTSGSNYLRLSHPLNQTSPSNTNSSNFFNSSIYTGGNSRSEEIRNNTGIDIAMFDIPNGDKSVIGNNVQSTQFRFGTSQDAYAIYNLTFSVDAYVPEVQAFNKLVTTGIPALGVSPGAPLEYKLEVKNLGTEAIDNAKIVIPLPHMVTFVSVSGTKDPSVAGGQPAPVYNPLNHTITWDLGNLPWTSDPNGTIQDINKILATLTYKVAVTTDCYYLSNPNCAAAVSINGSMEGVGSSSKVPLGSGGEFISNFNFEDNCAGEPIRNPISLLINVGTHCEDYVYQEKVFPFCDAAAPIEVSAIRAGFATGTRFYDLTRSIEYTSSVPFPAGGGSFIAVPPGAGDCVFNFRIDIVVINVEPTVAGDLVYCLDEEAAPLTAGVTNSNFTLLYYTSIGGSGLAEVIPATNVAGTFTYYVAQRSGSCVGPLAEIKVTVKPAVSAPGLGSTQAFCAGETPLTIGDLDVSSVTTGTVVWYVAATGGDPLLDTEALVSGTTYYASQIVDGCESGERTAVTVTISVILAPTLDELTQDFCEINAPTIASLNTAGGTAVSWYAAATGGTALDGTTKLVNGAKYYASQTVDGCESALRTEVTVTISAIPAPILTQLTQDFCEINVPTIASLNTAGGTLVQWYSAASGGLPLVGTTPLVDGTKYYASQTVDGCESLLRTEVTVSISAIPAPTLTQLTQEFCEINVPTVANLNTAGGTLVQWYTAASGGLPLVGTTPLVDGTKYYASQTVDGCESLLRTEVTVSISAIPAPTLTQLTQDFCEINAPTIASLNTAGGTLVQWYTATTGGLPLGSGVALVNGAKYYASQTVDGCESLLRTEITVTISVIPAPILTQLTQEFCEINVPTVANLNAAGGTLVQWYSAASGGSPLGSGVALVNGTKYYASQTVDDCESLLRTEVTVSISAIPAPTLTQLTQELCEINVPTVASLNTAGGTAVQWYTAANGGLPLGSGVALVNGVKYYASQTVDGCESALRTEVTVTISAIPAPILTQLTQDFCEINVPTIASLNTAGGTAVKWYAAATGGTALDGTTKLVNGAKYYASQTVDGCESLLRTEITVTISAIPAPILTQLTQDFCEINVPTIASLNTAGGTAVKWYAAATGGTALDGTTKLVNGAKYYASQTVDGCESLLRTEITVTISAIPAPILTQLTQDFCEINAPTIASLNTAGGTVVKWYAAATGGTALGGNTPLVDGAKYYASQTVDGCESLLRTEITVTISTIPTPILTQLTQDFCEINAPTIASLNTAGGTAVKWYAVATGGTALDGTIKLVNGAKYYASQTVDGCESLLRTEITVTISVIPAPILTQLIQDFCEINVPTIASLNTAGGTAVKWYATATGGTALAGAIPLIDGAKYYASQTVDGCESRLRTEVTVTISAIPAPILTQLTQDFCEINAPTIASLNAAGGTAVKWYATATGGTALDGTTKLVNGTKYYASQTVDGCESLLRTEITVTISAIPAPILTQLTQDFCEINVPTIASLNTAGGTAVKWYATAAGGTALAGAIPLIDGAKYYASQTIDGCESALRTEVTVTITQNPIVSAGPDQSLYNTGIFTMNATISIGVGTWTISENIGNVTVGISNANDPSATITIPVDSEVTLRWTGTNGDCSAFDEVILKSASLSISLDKTHNLESDGECFDLVKDQVITYTFRVKNTGNVEVKTITINDPLADLGTITMDASSDVGADNILSPNETWIYIATYSVKQSDIDAGQIYNAATVTANGPLNVQGAPIVVDSGADVNISICQTPSIALMKTSNQGDADCITLEDGEQITYTFNVKNTGNVTLYGVTIDDNDFSGTGTKGAIIWGANSRGSSEGTLLPNEIATYTMIYAVSAADIKAGLIRNQAIVAATTTTTSNEESVSDVSGTSYERKDPTVVTICNDAGIVIIKTHDADIQNGCASLKVDDIITYTFKVSNTGDVPLAGVMVTDGMLGVSTLKFVSGDANSNGVLDRNEVWVFTATYKVTQADIDAGHITNQATVAAGSPVGDVAAVSGTAMGSSGKTIISICQGSSIALKKTHDQVKTGDCVPLKVNDKVTYTFEVLNTGNVTFNSVNVIDEAFSGVGSLVVTFEGSTSGSGAGMLKPGEKATYKAVYVITQADVNAGFLDNQAKVTAASPVGVVSDLSGTDWDNDVKTAISICRDGSIGLMKNVTQIGRGTGGIFLLGDIVEYTFIIRNTGNVDLTNIVLTDPMLQAVGAIYIFPKLAVGEEVQHKAYYTVTSSDVAARRITNTALVIGQDPKGTKVEDQSGTTIGDDEPTVIAVEEEPTAKDDAATTCQNIQVGIALLTNDIAGSGPLVPSSVIIVAAPTNGKVTVDNTGKATYIPNATFFGEDVFTYRVSDETGLRSNIAMVRITVNKSNPHAVDDVAQTQYGQEVEIPELANDAGDCECPLDPTSVKVISMPQNGTVRIMTDGKVVYTPNPGYTGQDEFTYQVKDMNGNWSNIATIRITVVGFFIPNTFTPNGDGVNDVFMIVGLEQFEKADITIFNRWGGEVYRNSNYKNNWDGQGLNEGTYYYLIRLTKNGKEETFKGWVLLKR